MKTPARFDCMGTTTRLRDNSSATNATRCSPNIAHLPGTNMNIQVSFSFMVGFIQILGLVKK